MVKDAGKKIYNCLKEGKTEEELKQKLKKEAHKKNALQMELKEIHEGIKPLEKLRSLQGGAGCGEIPYHLKSSGEFWR